MIRSISAMDLLPKYSHSAIICGQTGCGKKQFLSWTSWRDATMECLCTLSYYVGTKRTMGDPGSGQTHRYSLSTLAIDCKSTCEHFTRSSPASPRCISSTTARPVKPLPKRGDMLSEQPIQLVSCGRMQSSQERRL